MSAGVEYAQQIIFNEQHQAKILHGCEVQAFVGDASGLAAIADVGHYRDVLALQTRTQRHACQHGNQITQASKWARLHCAL